MLYVEKAIGTTFLLKRAFLNIPIYLENMTHLSLFNKASSVMLSQQKYNILKTDDKLELKI